MSVELILNDETHNYRLYESKLVAQDPARFVQSCHAAKARFDIPFRGQQTTWTYRYYNFFALTSGFPECYDLLRDLRFIMRDYLKTDERLWFQSWFNFHRMDEVLKRHAHYECSAHGYISIEPKNTRTVFDGFEVANRAGLVYIGPPDTMHEVVVDEPFEGIRVTIAFDVVTEAAFNRMLERHGQDINLSSFPLD